jgi:hypothetical protein
MLEVDDELRAGRLMGLTGFPAGFRVSRPTARPFLDSPSEVIAARVSVARHLAKTRLTTVICAN